MRRQRLAGGLDRGAVEVHVHVPVAVVDVEVLGLHRRGQHDVGVVDGVGLELLHHDREQVLAQQALSDAALVRVARHRVGAVDHERLDGRVVGLQQVLAHQRHRQRADRRFEQVVPEDLVHRRREPAAGAVGGAAAGVAPVAGHAGQRVEEAQRVAAAGVALHAHRAADAGRARGRDALAERDDRRLVDAGDLGHPVRRELEDPLLELGPADGVLGEVVAVLRAAADDHVQQAERERGVGAWERREVLVRLRRGARLERVDRDDVRTLLARLEDELPQVMTARQRVRAPQQDQLGVLEGLRVHPGRGAGHICRADAARDAAGGHVVPRRAEHVPQPLAGAALESLDVAERPGPLERPDRLAAELVADRVQAAARSSPAPRPS